MKIVVREAANDLVDQQKSLLRRGLRKGAVGLGVA